MTTATELTQDECDRILASRFESLRPKVTQEGLELELLRHYEIRLRPMGEHIEAHLTGGPPPQRKWIIRNAPGPRLALSRAAVAALEAQDG